MRFLTTLRSLASVALVAAAGAASAADFEFSGDIALNTDVVGIAFSLQADAVDVQLGTTSWRGGINFDPSAALWSKAGSDWAFIDANDDADPLADGQGAFDAGFSLPSLAAGDYLLTIAASSNEPIGKLLSNGYALVDNQVPTPIASWNQPSYDINANDQKGTFWDVRLTGVDAASVLFTASSVPEPSMWLLMAVGLGAMGAWRLRASPRR